MAMISMASGSRDGAIFGGILLPRSVGEDAFAALKAESRRFQMGGLDAGGLYQRAQAILAGDPGKIAAWMQLASLLRDEPKRRALTEAHDEAAGCPAPRAV